MYIQDKRHPCQKPGAYRTHTFTCQHCHTFHQPHTVLDKNKPVCSKCGEYPFKKTNN